MDETKTPGQKAISAHSITKNTVNATLGFEPQERVKLHVDEYAEPAKHPHIWIQFSGVFAPEDGENIIQMIRDGLKRKPKTCGAFWGYKRFGYEKDGVKDADSHNCEEA